MPDFAAGVTCIDGRFQEQLTRWVRDRFSVAYVDLVTSPGVAAALADGDEVIVDEVVRELGPSLTAHDAAGVVIAAHEGCAADPSDVATQEAGLHDALATLGERLSADRPLVAVHLRADGSVVEIAARPASASG
jgi:hypothetical protein